MYGNKFIIPLDFGMLDSAAPYYQAGLGNKLCYELTFNDYNQVTKSRVSLPKVPDAKYKITDISLEYEITTQPDLVRSIRSKYQHMALLYDRILRHRKIIVNKKDTVWNQFLTLALDAWILSKFSTLYWICLLLVFLILVRVELPLCL